MKRRLRTIHLILAILPFGALCCSQQPETAEVRKSEQPVTGPTFQDDLDFLSRHKEVVLLKSEDGQAQVAVVPDYQGRVMTSTARGLGGQSFGWINRDLIASGELRDHMNAFGGEDRFWLGPEGGQFAIFFKSGDPFDLDHWQTPAVIDTVVYAVESSSDQRVVFRHESDLTNYSGTTFHFRIDRTVELLTNDEISAQIGPIDPALSLVAFRSTNTLTNLGSENWAKEGGTLSIWILGMFQPGPTMTVVIPYREGPAEKLGPVVNDSYFGKVPEDRLRVKGDHIFFRADGKYRSKIGVNPQRSKGIAGSYDWQAGVLTVVRFDQPSETTDYVNSMWEIQEQPYRGDAINSYNDGPPSPGAPPLGPFYEIETSSPAALLNAGQEIVHTSTTLHLVGTAAQLDPIARRLLGVSLEAIQAAF